MDENPYHPPQDDATAEKEVNLRRTMNPSDGRACAKTAWFVGAIANLIALFLVVPLMLESFGARTRPMQLGFIIPVAPVAAGLGTFFGIKAIRRGYFWAGLVAIPLALTPMPLCIGLVRWIVAAKQLVILD